MKNKNKKPILSLGVTKKYSKGVFLYLPYYKDKQSLISQIKFINSLTSVSHIEIWTEKILKLSEIRFLKSLLKNYEIIIHAPCAHLSLISLQPEIQETTIKLYIQTLKTASTLGAKLVTFHCGSTFICLSKKEIIKTFIHNFKKIKSHYKGKIAFTVENVSTTSKGAELPYPDLSDLVYLKKKLPWLNFTLDVGHVFRGGKNLSTISKFLKKYKNSILDIHLHDAILSGEDHLALGRGDLDFNKLFQILNEVGYTGYISLEVISNEDIKKSWQKIYKL